MKDIATKYGMVSNTSMGGEEKLFVILVEECSDSNKNKKINESLEYLSCQSLEVARKAEGLGSQYVLAGTSEEIKACYKSIFESLVVLFKQLILKYLK